MGSWLGGGFSDVGFSSGGFNTGQYVDDEETMGPPDKYTMYMRVMREDEEMLEFILNAVTSGILEQ